MAVRAHRLLFPSAFPRGGLSRPNPLLVPPSPTVAERRLGLPARPVFGRMASGDSRAPAAATSIPLQGGGSVEVVAAPGVSDSDLRIAINSSLFKQWLKNMQSERGLLAGGQMSLRQVYIQGVDMFGRGVGFLKFKADVFEKETQKKNRVPVGKLILELPAGMLDGEHGDVVGTAVREVEEEIGISLNKKDMVNLTAFLDPVTGCKVFPSPGGCDEELSLFLYRGNVKEEIINSLQGKEMGLREQGELIKVHVVPYDTLWRTTADAKALAAIALYEMAKRNGLLS